MPQRFLRPGITNSDAWNSVSFEAQSFYIRIITLVDDFGRYDGRIPVLHGQCFALRNDIKPQRTAALRGELHESGLIDVYAVDGKDYLQVAKWSERARCEKSKFPDKPEFTEAQDSAADGSVPQEKDASLAITSSPLHPRHSALAERAKGFAEFWDVYPKKKSKADAEKAWEKCYQHFEQIMESVMNARASPDWRERSGKFIPHPATWLNAKGWEDEYTVDVLHFEPVPDAFNAPRVKPPEKPDFCK